MVGDISHPGGVKKLEAATFDIVLILELGELRKIT